MIIPGHTPHWWSELETDIEHLIFRPDPDNRLPHEAQLAEQRLPLRRDLDAVAPDHSVVVVRGGHEYVLNSAGLVLWGITVDTPVPAGGEISRYDDGSLNGKLIDAAKNLVSLDPPPQRDVETRIADQLAEHARLHAAGLTSIRHPGGAPDQYELLAELKRRGELRIRVNFLFRARAARTAEELGAVVDAWPAAQDDGDEWLRVGGVKLGVDGGFEGGWMREPYAEPFGRGGTFHGLQTIPADRFTMAVTELNRRGWRVATHAVGDAAIDQVLAGYEAADAEGSIGGRRWTIEHGFIAAADQLARIRELGLVLSAQLVGDVPDAVGSALNLIYGDDDPDSVDHNVVVRTEADWLRDLEKELPFPRNVEAEGVQIHPVHRPARRPPGDRPPVTRKGIRHAVPVWLEEAGSDLKTLAYEIKELKDGRFKYPGMAAQPAFDAVFFSAMAWCLTRGVSVVRRKDLPTSVERHLIEPGALDPGWRNRIRMVWSAWKAEVDWQRGGDAEPTVDDAAEWAETAREFCALARDAIAAAGIEVDPPDEAGTSGNAAETEVVP